ncbi:MAG: hypothetical protein M3270_04690 [Thermoproteota archaeon]|nr:hypothetical protein [Thermoproteota archaeon]
MALSNEESEEKSSSPSYNVGQEKEEAVAEQDKLDDEEQISKLDVAKQEQQQQVNAHNVPRAGTVIASA